MRACFPIAAISCDRLSRETFLSLHISGDPLIHIMEPSWNKAKIDQAIGRGIRFKSHADLPPEERYVNVYYWLSVIPRGVFSFLKSPRPSADEYLYELSIRKNSLLELFDGVLCESSIENNLLMNGRRSGRSRRASRRSRRVSRRSRRSRRPRETTDVSSRCRHTSSYIDLVA